VAGIRALYAIEHATKYLDASARAARRQQQATPLLADLKIWLDRELTLAILKSPIHEALTDLANQWTALNVYLGDGDGDGDAGNSPTDAGGGQLPGRPLGVDAGGRAVKACGRHALEQPAIFGSGPRRAAGGRDGECVARRAAGNPARSVTGLGANKCAQLDGQYPQ
jgi:hypothetical protein